MNLVDVTTNNNKQNKLKTVFLKILKTWGPVIVALLICTFIVSSEILPNTVVIETGEPARTDIVAHRTVINTYATNKLKDEARRLFIKEESDSEDYFQINSTYLYQAQEDLDEVFRALQTYMLKLTEESDLDISSRLSKIDEYINQVKKEIGKVTLTKADITPLITLSQENFAMIWKAASDIITLVMKDVKIDEYNINEVKASVENRLVDAKIKSECIKPVAKIINAFIVPNLSLDVRSLERTADARAELVQPIYVQKDQIVVRRGDIVTEEMLSIANDLGVLKNNENIAGRLAVFGLMIVIFAIGIIYYAVFLPKNLVKYQNAVLVLLVYTFTLALAKLVMDLVPALGIYLLPAAFPAVVISCLINPLLAVVVSIITSFSLGIMAGGDIFVILLGVVGSAMAITTSKYLSERRKILRTVGAVCGALLVSSLFYNLMLQNTINVLNIILPLINGIIVIIIGLGTLPILEMMFGVVSNMSLLELLNSSHPLLHRMMFEAPGTYQHSVNVANLAETAANAIGMDSLLVRVAAQYHDCGKLKRPYFFVENQLGKVNPHDKMAPTLSTLVIMSHVKDGVELAQEYGLPVPICDIINQHHGTGLISYFYHQAVEKEKGQSIEEKYFRYPGPKPQSREAAIVMLADSTEAAVRSLQDPSTWNIKNLIHKLIWDRVEDGQMDECDITLKELNQIEEAFFQIMSGVHHLRIEYPDSDSKHVKKLDEVDIDLDNLEEEKNDN